MHIHRFSHLAAFASSFSLIFLLSLPASGQIVIEEGWEETTSLPSDWAAGSSPEWSVSGSSPCSGSSSLRVNLYVFNQSGNLTIPGWISNGNDIEVSFAYKVIDFFGLGATPPGWGEVHFQYSTDGGNTYTSVLTIDDSNHLPSATCEEVSLSIPGNNVSAGSAVRLRWTAQWTAPADLTPPNPDYWIYLDEISVSQSGESESAPACDAVMTFPENNALDAPVEGDLSWSVASGFATNYVVAVTNVSDVPQLIFLDTLGMVFSTNVGQLDYDTQYEVSITPLNENGAAVGCDLYYFTTEGPPAPGFNCSFPIVVDSLPYTTVDSIESYGNAYTADNSPDLGPVYPEVSSGASTGIYLWDNEAVYAFAPDEDMLIRINVDNHAAGLGLWVFEGCPLATTLAYHTGQPTDGRRIPALPVSAGETYYIVISSSVFSDAFYALEISETTVECTDLLGDIGGSCNDGDPLTFNDSIIDECLCVGDPEGFAGCISGGSFGSVNPQCDGLAVSVNTAFVNEYSTVAVTEEVNYLFSVNDPALMVTVTDEFQNVLAIGAAETSWQAAFTGTVRFYSHLDTDCSDVPGSIAVHIRMVKAFCPVFDCPEQEVNFGDVCDDNDPATFGSVVTEDCTCEGTPYDCIELTANIGDPCDDGDPTTFGGVVEVGCECVGIPYECPSLSANIGDLCNDDDPNTVDDVVTVDCECVGEPVEFAGCTTQSPFGDFGNLEPVCDGPAVEVIGAFGAEYSTVQVEIGRTYTFTLSNPAYFVTVTDENLNILAFGPGEAVWQAQGSGELYFFSHVGPDCPTTFGVETEHVRIVEAACTDLLCDELGLIVGDPCDDGDPTTFGVVNESCECFSTPYDCLTLQANIGDACDDGNPLTINTTVNQACNCAGTVVGFEGCISENIYGTLSPTCDDPVKNMFGSWTGEFTRVFVEAGRVYNFQLSNPDYFVTVTSGANNNIVAIGIGSALWEATSDQIVLFHSHAGPDCPTTTGTPTNHTRTVEVICLPDCPDSGTDIGDPCDDGNPETENDVITENCECLGIIPCSANGGEITLQSSRHLCVGDGEPDVVEISLDNAEGDNGVWVVLPLVGSQIIDYSFEAPDFNFDLFEPGSYRVRHVSYRDDVDVEGITDANQISGCYDPSNAVRINCHSATPGTVTTASNTTVCVGDGESAVIEAEVMDEIGERERWILTDDQDEFISLRFNNSGFEFDNLNSGVYRIYHLVFSQFFAPSGVNNKSDLGACAYVSNPIEVTAVACQAQSALLSSAPNPTDGHSQVSFTLTAESRALLEVYDLSGRKIEELWNAVSSEGIEYKFDFNGRSLPNGVYLYRLTTAEQTLISKFVIAR